jgi:predicted ATP-grasp superfamily ATP-dependent carboligase
MARPLPTAVVLNLFYTGLGICRSLGERGIPVIGLTAQHRIYGNFTRYASVRFSPDSRNEPGALLSYLLKLGQELGRRAVLFPTRDDDLAFLMRYREELEPYFTLAIAPSAVVDACLNKWETFLWARKAGVAAPRCWLVENEKDLLEASVEARFPCVLKPLSSHHWRQGGNWELVGARKAFAVSSREELLAEYSAVSRADSRAVLQELVPGSDDSLHIAACYLDRHSNWVAGFTAQKLAQVPAGFGTGCIVQVTDRPELFEPSLRLLQAMKFTGVAEVEYKWDAAERVYKLIEINPRPWDQHRLGNAAAADLIYLAYAEHVGLPIPEVRSNAAGQKWVAEDTFITTAFRMLWRRDPSLKSFLRLARGQRIYAVWTAADPLPVLIYVFTRFLPDLAGACFRFAWSRLTAKSAGNGLKTSFDRRPQERGTPNG